MLGLLTERGGSLPDSRSLIRLPRMRNPIRLKNLSIRFLPLYLLSLIHI